MSNEKGSLRSDSTRIKGGCYYRGYIDGFPSSAVTLSTCSGLRGLLQFENVSYGIEPLGYSPAFEHFVYRVSDEKMAGSLFATSHAERGPGVPTAEELSNKARGGDEVSVSVLAVVLMSPSCEEGSDPAGSFGRCRLDGQRWGG
ncbi:disintegrin and metalloproteinase domain-containing protein 18-like [Mycteria americana]|uniref:disintegrin and metalloproteinase domain-containing protein 18-like n=1 Tax=Mycteria americana TaxID=33587 RepID=UPI003F58BFF2